MANEMNNQNRQMNGERMPGGASQGNGQAHYAAKQPRDAAGARSAASASGAAAAADQPKKGKRTWLIVIGVVLAALIIWLLLWLFACNGSSFFDPSAQTGQAPYKTEEQMQAELDRIIEEGMFNISIASVIEFENSDAEGTAYIENVPNNRYNMKVAITEDSTGDTLYESGVLAPNQYIEKIALAKQLEAGSYGCTALFTALDPVTAEQTGQAAAKITVNVLN